MLDICGVSESQMPQLFESFEVVGQLTKEAAQTLGLPETTEKKNDVESYDRDRSFSSK